MPAQYTSERFVGRDEAFERLAARLDDAAGGRSRTMIVTGTAGVGVTRFLDEATVRMRALTEPMTVLRATAWIGGADEPYGADRPGHRPGAPGVARRRPGRPAGLRRLGGRPPPARPGRPARAERRLDRRPERHRARTTAGPDAGEHPGRARPPGRAQPGPARHRGPPPGRRRDPGARHVPGPDLARPAAGDRGHVPAGRRRARRPVAGGPRRDHVQPAAPHPARPPAARSRRAGRADRGHPGRARVGQPAAPRGRTVGWPAARRGGAPGGPTGAAEQLADRLVRRPRDRPDGDPLGRMPARRPADRARRAAPGSAAARGPGRRLRARHGPVGAALGERPARG